MGAGCISIVTSPRSAIRSLMHPVGFTVSHASPPPFIHLFSESYPSTRCPIDHQLKVTCGFRSLVIPSDSPNTQPPYRLPMESVRREVMERPAMSTFKIYTVRTSNSINGHCDYNRLSFSSSCKSTAANDLPSEQPPLHQRYSPARHDRHALHLHHTQHRDRNSLRHRLTHSNCQMQLNNLPHRRRRDLRAIVRIRKVKCTS
ncbi:hypothetical protein FIBSPDRAFT_421955 [Athelia psychrophila]|uniref:Uncharacterized protein n=1 Tax=Athelia psychrophila TaxID=1759441 RepID=A0A166MV22_9AGAM|nr:hypothetical protein FIBSPDRAFT_421955 [Fibularhizoctonia sp. CBS 109695]